MARREALRALQARLAERLRAAPAQAQAAGWLAVECAGQGLLFPLASAGEIVAPPAMQPVPHTRRWFLGVANLRGRLHGVVDLAGFLGLRAPLAADGVPETSRVIAFNPVHGSHAAVLVDRLAGLRSPGSMQALPEPAAPRPAFAGACWRDAGGRSWQEIDLSALATNAQFLGIAN
ncbi:MAG: chemotaxis protein CheW [Burkholderiales bacterium]|nr:chemotaxis protein CheW [Burkholderiales bacterium]